MSKYGPHQQIIVIFRVRYPNFTFSFSTRLMWVHNPFINFLEQTTFLYLQYCAEFSIAYTLLLFSNLYFSTETQCELLIQDELTMPVCLRFVCPSLNIGLPLHRGPACFSGYPTLIGGRPLRLVYEKYLYKDLDIWIRISKLSV